ncbi:MAG: VWA domain-containing protein [Candidatus Hydrogenedentes bacterium]|nr:VWA domain-containing protein [Candidatus Hydrogenedentota bacterium]
MTLNFGSFATNKLFTIANAGTGTVNWTVNTAGLPAWLSVAAPTSGSITTTAHGVLVSANRTGLAPGNYTHDLSVTSSPNVGSATVSVTMTVAVTPVLTIETGQVSADERPLVPLGDRDTTLTFTIRNTGTGSLDWNIDPAEFPSWLAMAPVAGSLTTQTDTVTVTVDRTDLAVGAYKQDVPVTSNGGNAIIEVSMVVPLRASIGTDADELDFGLLASVGSFGVANYGDPGTILNFTVSSDKVWLFNSPSTGNSIGVASPPPFKDYRTISVSVDRGSLESRGSTGTFTIQAVDGTGAVITDIAPKQVLVSVEAAPLSFELANARTRIPSLVQFAFIMRHFRNRAMFATPADLANSFPIIENGVSLETTETNQFVTSGANLRTNMVIMLDFSGSVYDAAQGLGLLGTDQLHAAYEQTVSDFIDGIPAQYRVALMEFHDRSQATRLVRDFTEDKTALKTALHDIRISDHGASPILPAVDDAAGRLRDVDAQLLSFDNADVRALVMVSDGRLTTPPGIMQDTVDLAVANRMRIFSIGWGKDVNNEPLARLAVSSGGHYYATRGDANGDPTVAELDQKLQTILSDLSSQMVLTYVTLNETERVPARVNAQVNDPNDSPDEGLLQGTFAQDLKLSEIAGDVKMGQISMRSSGVAGGAATVTLRLDYAPRNVNKFRFTLTSAEAFDPPALVTAADGGATDGWTLTPLGGGVYTLTAPAPTDVLQYGAFGNLLTLTFPAVGVTPFTVALTVDNTIYSADPEPKYFVYPDTITVGADGSIAPAFPTALIAPTSIAFGTALNSQALTVQNIGGSYPYGVTPSSVQLNWEVQSNPTFVTVDPADGSRNTTVGADTVTVTADRTGDPGFYSGTIVFVYTGNTLAIANSIQIPITMQITNPALSVSSNLIDFGAVSTSDTLTITNSGQSTLNWQFSAAALPTWLTATPSSGITTSETDSIGLTVDRTGLTVGNTYTYTIPITSNGGTQNVTINVTG